MSFAIAIKQERERLGITQAQAASLLGVSKSVIEKWEADTRTPLEITQEGVLERLRKNKPRK
jgi:transcriptional regulator with XRE-family HTH domain